MNSTKNTEILKKHFHNVFNRNTEIDPTVINQIDNHNNLHAFHHSAIRRILGIWMDEVKECHIMNEQVKKWFNNIPTIDDFIARRTWTCMGKALRTKNDSLPKKMLGAWIPMARKTGRPQSNFKDNFIQAIKTILKNKISDEAMFKEWFLVAADKKNGTR